MAEVRDLSHNPSYADRIFSVHPEATRASENVGRSTGTDRSIFDAYMASAGHRAHILDAAVGHVTIACAVDSTGELWNTMDFWG